MNTASETRSPQRAMAFWFPDWPITTRALTTPSGWDDQAPIAITHANTIIACSATARAAGVRRGQRRRDAQAACSGLQLMPHDPDRDARAFSPVVSRIEALAPGVHIVRSGLCVLRSRGPSRYYGGEREAATVLRQAVAEYTTAHSLGDTRVGIADGPFTAEQAARLAHGDERFINVVAAGEAATFLAPLPITIIDDDNVASLLARLGVHTLGEFASLDEQLVRDRLNEQGARLHALACGQDSRPITARMPPPELAREVEFDSPVALADQVAFAVRQTADDVITAVSEAALVCTEIRIEFTDDRGITTDRVWLHPTCFDAAALVDRVRWQLQSMAEAGTTDENALGGGVVKVRLTPEAVDASSHHQPALLGRGTDSRVHHALSRVQALLGHGGVVTAEVIGGRMLTDRQHLVPWGDKIVAPTARTQPWPGQVPPPLPTTIFSDSVALDVLDADDERVTITDRGALASAPAAIVTSNGRRRISSWAGPWPVKERIWLENEPLYRFQIVDENGVAWVVVAEGAGWRVEGRYD